MTEAISAAVTAKVLENLKENGILPQPRQTRPQPVEMDVLVHEGDSSLPNSLSTGEPHTVCHTTHNLLAILQKTCLVLALTIPKHGSNSCTKLGCRSLNRFIPKVNNPKPDEKDSHIQQCKALFKRRPRKTCHRYNEGNLKELCGYPISAVSVSKVILCPNATGIKQQTDQMTMDHPENF
ncbi:unnamed protein product [Mytilus coruscus]|uniref:Uncharacterized protein n=1 Tax=Mytilus coruscus TaxID=42192 RepID=A0A6J8CHN0_MYTCO|nr:unnamed protein product [Mytilus coruscus]